MKIDIINKRKKGKKETMMNLPSDETLYKILIFLLSAMVILGIIFDTDFN